MARQLYTAAEAAELVVGRDSNYISSSEVSEIDEDDEFPLPRSDSDDGFSSRSVSLTPRSVEGSGTPDSSPTSRPFSPSSRESPVQLDTLRARLSVLRQKGKTAMNIHTTYT